ncbi:FkbM family methyltransferase [Methylocystis sp. IM2]
MSLPRHFDLSDAFLKAKEMEMEASSEQFPPFEVSVYKVPFDSVDLNIECWLGNIVYSFIAEQYYFHRNDVQIGPRAGDIVVDAGACFGDTALGFAASVGPTGSVHAFEPIPKQASVFERNTQRNPTVKGRIHLHRYALSDTPGQKLQFSDSGAGARASEKGAVEVETTSIDTLVDCGVLPRVDFIKMDIEGAEVDALKGAAKTIKQFKPRLAISVYHRESDFIEIPQLISSFCSEYDLFLDHHTVHQEETVLYALAP